MSTQSLLMNKLLHISANTYSSLDGKHHHTKNIWMELAKGFNEYHIIARSLDNSYSFSQSGNIYLHLIPRITKKSKIFFITSLYMFRIIQKHKITHLLSQCPILGGFSAVMASKFFKIPIMVEIHGEEYFNFLKDKYFMAKLLKFVFNNVQKIRTLNYNMSMSLNKNGINKNIIKIPNRVNLSIFNKTKDHFSINNTVKIVSIGRFTWEKDYLNLIKYLHNSSLDFHLTLIGGGNLKNKYRAYIKKNKINAKIDLIDWIQQEELVKIVVDSDIYIQSSVSEGMPRTIIEAMALQMPIISTNAGSIEGVLINNKNAIVIKTGSELELIVAIKKMIDNNSFREAVARQGYKDVVEKYEWNKVFELHRKEILNMKYENS
ncbi:Glycosyl transferase, group 1 family protein [uncultured Candidatus Thioglobus sp.]|nr:Glycosyl transferase, group 1 family protein [uncultured Candidatus Thioglobus sp.]